VLLPVDGYPEYAEVYEYCRHGGVVHLPVSLAAGLNLPVDYVVSVTKQVALVVRHPELEFMKTRVDQMLAFNKRVACAVRESGLGCVSPTWTQSE